MSRCGFLIHHGVSCICKISLCLFCFVGLSRGLLPLCAHLFWTVRETPPGVLMKVLNEKFQHLVLPGGKLTNIASNALFIICVCLTSHSVMSKRGQPNENKHHVQNKLRQKLALKVTTCQVH